MAENYLLVTSLALSFRQVLKMVWFSLHDGLHIAQGRNEVAGCPWVGCFNGQDWAEDVIVETIQQFMVFKHSTIRVIRIVGVHLGKGDGAWFNGPLDVAEPTAEERRVKGHG